MKPSPEENNKEESENIKGQKEMYEVSAHKRIENWDCKKSLSVIQTLVSLKQKCFLAVAQEEDPKDLVTYTYVSDRYMNHRFPGCVVHVTKVLLPNVCVYFIGL